MNTSIKAFISVIAFGASALFMQAEPALKLGTVDLGKALGSYYKTQEEQTKLQAFEADANKKFEGMLAEGRAMADKFKSAQEAFASPIATESAKKTAQEDGNRLLQELQKKETDLNQFRQQAVQALQQSAAQTRQQLIIEISNVANDIAKKKGLTALVERSALVYSDASYDITDEVVAKINEGKTVSAAPSVGLPK